MKLSQWAKKNNIPYRTAHAWYKTGKLPVESFRTPSGAIFVKEAGVTDFTKKQDKCVLYARVSSHDQTEDLKRQVTRLQDFAAANGMIVSQTISEIGSGLNGSRPKLLKLLADREVSTIIVEHRDRLTRFGFEYLSMALSAQDRTITVINESDDGSDLVQDFVDVVTSMCARIYGKRGAKNRAKRAIASAELEPNEVDSSVDQETDI